MKKFALITALILSTTLLGCSSNEEVSGRSIRTANKSAIFIKRHLPIDQQVEFEVAYGTIRTANKDDKVFLDKVGGKKADEIIASAKEIFEANKAAGIKEYQKYTSWEQMIANFEQIRIEQSQHKKVDPRETKKNPMYEK
jgi:N12 class adenine-specific DNA methylase